MSTKTPNKIVVTVKGDPIEAVECLMNREELTLLNGTLDGREMNCLFFLSRESEAVF